MVLFVGQVIYGIAYYNGMKRQVLSNLRNIVDFDRHLIDVEYENFTETGELTSQNAEKFAEFVKKSIGSDVLIFKISNNQPVLWSSTDAELSSHEQWFLEGENRDMLKEYKWIWEYDKEDGDLETAVLKGSMYDGILVVAMEHADVNNTLNGVVWQSVFISLILLIVMAIVSMWYISMMITPVTVIADAIKDIAQGEGDLTKHIDLKSEDEVGELARWFNVFIDKQREMISVIANNLNEALTQTQRLTEKSLDVKEGSNEQRDHVNRVATAVEELSSTVNEVAMNAEAVSSKSKETTEKAKQGSHVVRATIEKMNSISDAVEAASRTINSLGEKGAQIGEIISVIDDIADQTNLLALNAAIEAARAGEQGRGFAVVADEVRKLAERTSQATKEVADTIKTIQQETTLAVEEMERSKKEVEAGKEMAQQSGQALTEIDEATGTVTIMVSQIADATKEQSKATEEITQSIEGITLLANKVSDLSNETSAVADGLAGIVNEIKSLVSRFKLS